MTLRYILIIVLVLLAGCKREQPGSWVSVDFGRPDNTIFELNFVSADSGWLTTWKSDGQKETEGWEILRTVDGGKTWSLWPAQIEHKIRYVYFVNGNLGWALNLSNDILQTTDGGETWNLQRKAGRSKVKYNYNNPGAPTEVPDPLQRLYFLNERIGWAWGGGKKEDAFEQEGVFLRTVDGGKTWQQLKYQFGHELQALFFLDPDIGWASDRKAGLFRTVDGGKTWQQDPDDMRRPPITGIFFIDLMKGWIVGAEGYTAYTLDGGKNWTRVRTAGRNFLNAVCFVDEKTGWSAGENGAIFRTQDGGLTWKKEQTQSEGTITRLQLLSPQKGWAAGNSGVLLKLQTPQ